MTNCLYDEACPFCNPLPGRVFFESPLLVGLWDGFPVAPGHALLVPRRHVATWFDATREERAALTDAIDAARTAIEREHRPDGYNIGINVGAAAGQTVFHLHLHVIPRYQGDMADPRGGVRHVIPENANYLANKVAESRQPYVAQVPKLLTTGGKDPLWVHLAAHLDHATTVDVVVAFVKPSGTQLLWPRLAEVLDRGGRVRFLTGDYLGITEPSALVELLNLAGREGARSSCVCSIRALLVSLVRCLERFTPKPISLSNPKELDPRSWAARTSAHRPSKTVSNGTIR